MDSLESFKNIISWTHSRVLQSPVWNVPCWPLYSSVLNFSSPLSLVLEPQWSPFDDEKVSTSFPPWTPVTYLASHSMYFLLSPLFPRLAFHLSGLGSHVTSVGKTPPWSPYLKRVPLSQHLTCCLHKLIILTHFLICFPVPCTRSHTREKRLHFVAYTIPDTR